MIAGDFPFFYYPYSSYGNAFSLDLTKNFTAAAMTIGSGGTSKNRVRESSIFNRCLKRWCCHSSQKRLSEIVTLFEKSTRCLRWAPLPQ
jgi:hypothetical protein